MVNIDYYELLEISKDADKSTIKKAYRKMAMKYHPDKNQGDSKAEEKFKAINEAYQVLSDDQKRSIYDRYGKEGLEGMGGGARRGGSAFDDLGSIFEEMFGGGFSRKRERKTYNYNLDTIINVSLDFNEAVFGAKKNIKYKYKTACKDCKGTGAKNGKLTTCDACAGRGEIRIQQGFMTFAQTCPHCQGSGKKVGDKCPKCSGIGYQEIEDNFEVDIPEGIDSGNRMRVGGKGNIAPDGSRGDLYLEIDVKEDKYFIRNNNDIYVEVPIFFTQIALGTTIKVPSLRGEVELKVPAGSPDKKQFIFRGEGVKSVQSYGKGDFVVQIKIQYPKTLTSEQKELLEKLQDSFGIQSKPHEDIFTNAVDKIKNWFK